MSSRKTAWSTAPFTPETDTATPMDAADLPYGESMQRVPEFELLHDAGGVVVVNKPAGLESTGRTTDDPGGVQHHLQRRLGRRLWLVHQLDRETSGALIFVRKKALVAVWQERLRASTKRYLAIVRGAVAFGEQVVDGALAYDREARRWRIAPDGKRARTELRVLEVGETTSLVEARIQTGRTHQIRVHLASLGHPLIGESRYRDPPCELHARHALHAWRIELEDPRRVFVAPVPADLLALAERLGLGNGDLAETHRTGRPRG